MLKTALRRPGYAILCRRVPLQYPCHPALPLMWSYLHFWLWEVESLQVLALKVLPCFTSSEAMESPTSKSAIIRLLMNLK